jgi:hypothetical protein
VVNGADLSILDRSYFYVSYASTFLANKNSERTKALKSMYGLEFVIKGD